MKRTLWLKSLLGFGAAIAVILFFVSDLHTYLTLVNLKAGLDDFRSIYREHTAATLGIYMAGYIAMAAFSLPGATVVSLAGGAVFGLFTGVVVVSFASTIGATLAFLFSRYLFREWVQTRFSSKIAAINKGVAKEGGFYLFTLRLLPVFPFFVINLVMGLTPIRTRIFYLVSQIGMLPGTIVYINAGTALGEIDSLGAIFSFKVIFSFVLLGLFPIAAKKVLAYFNTRKVYEGFKKPAKFDYNLVVIGAGAGGLISSYIASTVKAKVALIEENKMGGDCLNTGCVPSKSLIATARLLSYTKRAETFGLDSLTAQFQFQTVMDRVRKSVEKVAPHDSVERFQSLGVECIKGRAFLQSPFEVKVGERVITTRSIIVATGARPRIPAIDGLGLVPFVTSDTIWDLKALPDRLVVLGGGPIGCELAQAFLRLGSRVTLVQRGERIMKREDPDASQQVLDRFLAEGMDVRLGHTVKRFEASSDEHCLVCEHQGEIHTIAFDMLLVALGREPVVEGFGLEELGIAIGEKGELAANGFLQTNFPNIFACGDVLGQFQFTHAASHEAWYASVNALFGRFKKIRADYSVIPWATFTDPEVARVGLNEQEAKENQIPYEKVVYDIGDLDRAIADSEDHGFVKVLTVPGKHKILGVTIVGNHSADIISEFVLAMRHGIGLNKILGTVHVYPTMAEANKYAAGMWSKAHVPRKVLAWAEKFHAWMRN